MYIGGGGWVYNNVTRMLARDKYYNYMGEHLVDKVILRLRQFSFVILCAIHAKPQSRHMLRKNPIDTTIHRQSTKS